MSIKPAINVMAEQIDVRIGGGGGGREWGPHPAVSTGSLAHFAFRQRRLCSNFFNGVRERERERERERVVEKERNKDERETLRERGRERERESGREGEK
jgi:hypothetical protein